ncbi:hypothetical protein GCM10009801_72680 [Streptomyces albiaxialis]|uniref:Resolvase/invertase-type recombinase catalytic domain-containing protein n=1 Tax=Streptomyces albiaxialis TaxID=329523 RepID=A0ABN2WWR4_9ACTN
MPAATPHPPERRRAVVLASLVPLSELEDSPFLVDTRRQYAACRDWAERNGYAIAATVETNNAPVTTPALWQDVEAGAEAFLCAGPRILDAALESASDFAEHCASRGIRLITVECPEPAYTAEMKAAVHRRLSLPTAGYDGC